MLYPTPQLSGPEWMETEHFVPQRLGQLSEVQWLSFYGQPSMFAQLKTELLLPPGASPLPLGKSRTSTGRSPTLHCRTGPFPYPFAYQASRGLGEISVTYSVLKKQWSSVLAFPSSTILENVKVNNRILKHIGDSVF